MLYRIRDGVSVFDDNPELLAIPEFARLLTQTALVNDSDRDRRMRFVILVADRKSPLRTLPEKQRREKASLICGWKMEGTRLDRRAREIVGGKIEVVEAAIAKYRELQFDENQDTLEATTKLIRTNREFIDHVNNRTDQEKKDKQYGKDLELANKLSKQIPELLEAKQKIEAILNIVPDPKLEIQTYTSVDIDDDIADTNLSLIDQVNSKP